MEGSEEEEDLVSILEQLRKDFVQINYGDPREFDQALLTYTQREYLLDQKEFDGDNADQSKATLRNRMRNRIAAGISDFRLLTLLSEKDRKLIFEKIDGTDHPLYLGLQALLEFVYLGVRDYTKIDFDSLLEDALKNIGRGSTQSYRVDEVVVDIDIRTKELPDLESTLKRLEEGKQVSNEEIGMLARFGMLTEEHLENLHELPEATNILPVAIQRVRAGGVDTIEKDDSDTIEKDDIE